MKLLNGSELAGYIKERQRKEAQTLILNYKIKPCLAILISVDNPVINLYVSLKQKYGQDLDIQVRIYRVDQKTIQPTIQELNEDNSVHGIIIQLPIFDPLKTDQITELVSSLKDVDALGTKSIFEPATPMAIMWLLAGYNIDLSNKKVLLIGKGKLVGKPLLRMLLKSGIDVSVADRSTKDLKKETLNSDVIITATGSPAILYADMFKKDAIVVDAGVASEEGKVIGDLDDSVYQREDLTITPKKGGVGPLTVCALFENVLKAAKNQSKLITRN